MHRQVQVKKLGRKGDFRRPEVDGYLGLPLKLEADQFEAACGAMSGGATFVFKILASGGSGEIFFAHAIFVRGPWGDHDGTVLAAVDKNTGRSRREIGMRVRCTLGRLGADTGLVGGPESIDILRHSRTRGNDKNG